MRIIGSNGCPMSVEQQVDERRTAPVGRSPATVEVATARGAPGRARMRVRGAAREAKLSNPPRT